MSGRGDAVFRSMGERRDDALLDPEPHVPDEGVSAAYLEMAADEVREAEAFQWSDSLISDVAAEAP